MSLQQLKKELQDLRKNRASGFKTIEDLLKTPKEGLQKLTDDELFRILQYYNPELTLEGLDVELEKIAAEERAVL